MNYDVLPDSAILSKEQAEEILSNNKDKIYQMLKNYIKHVTDEDKAKLFYKTKGKSYNFSLNKMINDLDNKWEIDIAGNAIHVKYIETAGVFDKKYYVPSILIYYPLLETKEPVYSTVIERYPLGYCSCGEAIPEIQLMIRIENNLEKGGIHKALAFFQNIKLKWMLTDELSQYSVMFNRARCCL